MSAVTGNAMFPLMRVVPARSAGMPMPGLHLCPAATRPACRCGSPCSCAVPDLHSHDRSAIARLPIGRPPRSPDSRLVHPGNSTQV